MPKINLLFTGLLIVFFSSIAFTAEISQVKGKKAVATGADDLTEGAEYFIMNADGKKVGYAVVKQIKGNKALLDITKGSAKPGYALESAEGGGDAEGPRSKKGGGKKSGKSWGVTAGYKMNTMSIAEAKAADGTKGALNLTGSSFTLKGFFDLPMGPKFIIRLGGGLDGFTAAGSTDAATSAICGNTTGCGVSYSYMAIEGHLYYLFSNSNSMRFYAGIGYQMLMASSVSSNIVSLDTSSKTNGTIPITIGADIKSGRNFYPIYAYYGIFPGGSGIAASTISFGGGWGKSF